MTTLKQMMESHGKTLATLEACCQNFATTTSSLRDRFEHMNINLNQKIEVLHLSIEQLSNSPTRHMSKHREDHHGLPDINLH
jgi:hypothetical protein